MPTNMKRLRFKDIAPWMPKDHWAVQRLRANPHEFAGTEVLYTQGDVQTSAMDLAAWGRDTPHDPHVFLIVVAGSVKADVIFNVETARSTGLVVMGDVDVGHVIVGGQEIYVAGHLQVRELWWGDCGHGGLVAPLGVSARLLMSTNGYALPVWRVDERTDAPAVEGAYVRLQDDGERLDPEVEVAACYVVDALIRQPAYLTHSFADVLDRQRMIDTVLQGGRVLHERFVLPQPEVAPYMLGDGYFVDARSLQAQKPHWEAMLACLSPEHPQTQFRSLHDAVTVQWSRTQVPQEDGAFVVEHFFDVLTDDGLQLRLDWDKPGRIHRWLEIPAQLQATYRRADQPHASWKSAFKEHALRALLSDVWDEMLHRAQAGLYWQSQLRKRVTAHQVLQVLQLPVVRQRYHQWRDPARNGYWDGPLRYAFHLPTPQEPWAMLRIARQHEGAAQEDVYAYDFCVTDPEGAPDELVVRYSSSQCGMPVGWPHDPYCRGPQPIALCDGHLMQEALRWFLRCQSRVVLHALEVA